MRGLPILAAVVGIAAIAALVGYFGAGAVIRSLLAVGGTGFLAICAIHLVLIAVMGLAWRALLPGVPATRVMWARLVRDSGSEALPLSLRIGTCAVPFPVVVGEPESRLMSLGGLDGFC